MPRNKAAIVSMDTREAFLAKVKEQGLVSQAELVESGQMPEKKRVWTLEDFANRGMIILTQTVGVTTYRHKQSGEERRGLHMDVIDPLDGEQNQLWCSGDSALAWYDDQFAPMRDHLPAKMAVWVECRPHSSRPGGLVFSLL